MSGENDNEEWTPAGEDEEDGAEQAEQKADDLLDGLLSLGDEQGSGQEADDGEHGLELDDQQSAEIRRIFGTTLPQYLQPVEEMVAQVLDKPDDIETAVALSSTLQSLGAAATRMGFDEVRQRLEAIGELVEELQQPEGREAAELQAAIEANLALLKKVAGTMSDADLAAADSGSPTIFSVLKDSEAVDEAALRKLSAAGVVTVDQLRMARPDEIAAVSGLSAETVSEVLFLLSGDGADEGAERSKQGSGENPDKTVADSSEGVVADRTDDSADASPAVETSAQAQSVVELPVAAETMHDLARAKRRLEVETRAAVEELRYEVERLKAGLRDRRSALRAAAQRSARLRRELASFSARFAQRQRVLDQLRSQRSQLANDCALRERALGRDQSRASELREQEAQLRQQESSVARHVGELVDRLSRVRRLAAKGREGKP